VVASDAGGLREIVSNNETGVLVPPGDSQALGDALLSLLENRERAERMGGNARQFALQHLTEEAFVNRFLGLYELLCEGRTLSATG